MKRRSSGRTRAQRDWAAFVAANRERLQAAGLPPLATRSIAHWDDLLMHGHFEYHTDPTRFTIDSLTELQYNALVNLVESYFLAGYEYFTPAALKLEDRRRLTAWFHS